jgi:EAL domain-containing protein (putative c-di-GMP-specific phosphodiesterase class I)
MLSAQHILDIQNQLHDVLDLSQNDIRLGFNPGNLQANFLGLTLRSVFQPIVNVQHDKPLGYEALLRASDADGQAVAPPDAFVHAELAQQMLRFDRVCRTLHTLNYLSINKQEPLLFLNVHPDLLVASHTHGEVFGRILHHHAVPTEAVVIEVNESEVKDAALLNVAISNYRERGYRIAIDDFGKAHSNLDRIWTLSPEYVKLDGSIIQQAETNSQLQRILPKLVEIMCELGAEVIVEGVETQAQLEIATHAGVHLIQGYHTGRPAPATHWQTPAPLSSHSKIA